MSEERIAALEANLRSVTDQVGSLMDLVMQRNFRPLFRCGHSGLYLPADYLRGWGRRYGIGLGVDPVSEVLDTDYDTAPPAIDPRIRSLDQIMHPMVVSRAQVDFVMVAPDAEAPLAVIAEDDPYYEQRAAIVRPKQVKNPRGRLRTMAAAWAAEGGR